MCIRDRLKDAANDCMSDIQWFASVKNGSIALAAYPSSSTETSAEIDECLAAIHSDFVCMRGGKAPTLFSDKTLDPVSYTHLDVYKRQGGGNKGLRRAKQAPEVVVGRNVICRILRGVRQPGHLDYFIEAALRVKTVATSTSCVSWIRSPSRQEAL